MTNQKQSSKRQTIVIAILAVLLVGMLAFNVTYAFFTDKQTNTDSFEFGTIELKDTNTTNGVVEVYRGNDALKTPVMPGDIIKGNFGLQVTDESESAYVRYKIEASADTSALVGEGFERFAVASEGDTPVIAYINGELVQAVIANGSGDVTVYNDGKASDSVDTDLATKIKAYKGFTTYTEGDTKTVITFKANAVEMVTTGVVATVMNYTSENQAGTEVTDETLKNAAIQKGAELAATVDARISDIETAIKGINNAFQATLAGLKTDDYIVAGDGWIYKKAAMDKNSGVESVAVSYTLPIETGNALQGITVNFALDIDAVQAANTSSAVSYDKHTGWSALNDGAKSADAVKVFYAALYAHDEIYAK